MARIQKNTPFLCFDRRASEASEFYVSVSQRPRMPSASRLEKGVAEGAHLVTFELDVQEFTALVGGPMFQYTPAVSLAVNDETRNEVDHLRGQFFENGVQDECDRLRDKFGVSSQANPVALPKFMSHPPRAAALTEAILRMQKLDIRQLQNAHDRA